MSDAARLEALGEREARLVWRGHDLVIPRAVEDWPLDLIRAGLYVDALETLLDGQTAPIPMYGDAVDLADAMAEAVGVSRLPETPELPANMFGTHIFGAVPILLWLLGDYEDDIASDLKTYRHVDYLDRWRGELTLRQIWIYIRRLPADSALALARRGGREAWTKQAIVTAQLWEALVRKPYVGRPMTAEEIDAALAKKRENEKQMNTLAEKADYYSPEASRRRYEEWLAKKAAESGEDASKSPAAAGTMKEPPPAALAAMGKALATRQRELDTTRKAAG